MSIWEKAVLNMQKGSRKITASAAVFSERINAEIVMIRLKIKADEIQARIDALHIAIGKSVMNLKKSGDLPKTTEQFLKQDAVVSAMDELSKRESELAELQADIQNVFTDFKSSEKTAEDTIA
jgi:hypothetical protein